MAYRIENLLKLSSLLNVSTDSMISRAMKSHTNEQIVRGGPTLNFFKRFGTGRYQCNKPESVSGASYISDIPHYRFSFAVLT